MDGGDIDMRLFAKKAGTSLNFPAGGGYRQKFCEDRRRRGWSIQPSSAPKASERRFDFRIRCYAAAPGLVDRLQFVRRGVACARTARFNISRVFGELVLVFWRPGLHLLE
jgi:hypothetical protein